MTTMLNGRNRAAIARLRKYSQPILGFAELADVAGESKTCVANWVERGKVPKPDFKLAATPCWYVVTLEAWLREQEI
jgi:hypothetical protein